MDEYNTRSSLIKPESLSNSYFAREPFGISIMAFTNSGASSPQATECQGLNGFLDIKNGYLIIKMEIFD
jgi:hypothetical protein